MRGGLDEHAAVEVLASRPKEVSEEGRSEETGNIGKGDSLNSAEG